MVFAKATLKRLMLLTVMVACMGLFQLTVMSEFAGADGVPIDTVVEKDPTYTENPDFTASDDSLNSSDTVLTTEEQSTLDFWDMIVISLSSLIN